MALRIVHYYPRALAGNGGVSSAVRGWAAALTGAGAEVTVLYDEAGETPAEAAVRWIAVPHRGRGRLRAPIRLEPHLRGYDLLVLHSGWVYHNLVAARVAVGAAIPYVLTPHGAYDPNVFRRRGVVKGLWWRAFERRLVSRACAVHVFFEEQRDELRDAGFRGPVIVAPTGLTMPDVPSGPAARGDFLLWMGRFDVQTKGIDLLLRAIARLPAGVRRPVRLHGPDWRDGKRRVTELIRELGLADSVTVGRPLYGAEKWDALRTCAAFVSPSRWDAQGLMTLEAAAAGAPLVVTSTTPLGRCLGRNGVAVLVEPTPEGIADGIERIRSGEAAGFGARAAGMVDEKFSWPAVAASYLRQVEALPTTGHRAPSAT